MSIFLNILKGLAMLLVTILILLFWINDFYGWLALVFGCLIFIPAIIAAIVIMIRSRKMANKSQKFFLAWGILNVVFLVAYFLFWHPKQQCNADIMAEHYEKHAKEMEDFISYLDNALDDSVAVRLEFEYGKATMFHVAAKGDSLMSTHWGDAEEKKDSLMSVVGLTRTEYDQIRDNLRSLGCIGVERTTFPDINWTVIYFRRSGMGMYSFYLFDKPMSQKDKDYYMNDYSCVPYNEKVVFIYGGGAFLSDRFPGKDDFLKKHKPW
ncbi:MAG: hypothetical protein J5770_06160 [Bacteroidaceae bacterium]|nr:hypothetical protein [Bacteroidaceae bacterium]